MGGAMGGERTKKQENKRSLREQRTNEHESDVSGDIVYCNKKCDTINDVNPPFNQTNRHC